MKKLFTILLASCLSIGLSAQEKRASPLVEKTQSIDNLEVKLQYGETSMKGREIFGDLVPYGKVWRTGANEATVLEFNQDVTIAGNKVKAGKYSLFTIPGEENWTVIVNSIWNQWGAYNYDKSKDVLRFEVESGKSEKHEKLVLQVSEEGLFELMWEETTISFKIEKLK